MTSSYKHWVSRVHDHAQTCNFNWRRLLDIDRSSPVRLTRATIQSLTLDDVTPDNLMTLSFNVWSFLGSAMKDNIYNRREALAGGEEGNRFEL